MQKVESPLKVWKCNTGNVDIYFLSDEDKEYVKRETVRHILGRPDSADDIYDMPRGNKLYTDDRQSFAYDNVSCWEVKPLIRLNRRDR